MKRILQLLFLILLNFQLFAQITSTWSGQTTIGNSNGVALAAAFWYQPHSMCADALNNIWVTDAGNHDIKLIRSSTVYNRAGSQLPPATPGAYGYTNALSSSALFHTPRGIICDANNNIYVCDYDNNAIRKIDAFTTIGNAQTVTTLCGAPETTGIAASGTTDGVGTIARFNGPSGICKDNLGNFYVTDENNNMIRKIVIATGAVTTLCGTASGSVGALLDGNFATAKFKYPRGITFSVTENALYVSDFGNNRIRKIDLTSQMVTVWAGGGSGFAGDDGHRTNVAKVNVPEGITLDALGNLLFTTGPNAHTVRRVEKSSNNIFTFAGVHQTPGATNGVYKNALFNIPTGLMLSGSTLYICDYGNGLLRAIDLKPVVYFNATQTAIVTGTPITLEDTSRSMVTGWAWTITPGAVGVDYVYLNSTSATSKNPQLKFNNPGTYTVKLDVTNDYGTNTLTKANYIVVSNSGGQPSADFTVDKQTGDVTTIFTFTNQTTNSAGCTYSWVFAPSNIAYLNGTTQGSANPQVRFSSPASYSVTLNVTHPTFTVSPKIKANYILVTGVGINETRNEFLFNVFPNPNSGNFTLITSQHLDNAKALVTDVQGKTIASISLLDQQEQNISLPQLNPGIYFMRIISADKVATQRLVIE